MVRQGWRTKNTPARYQIAHFFFFILVTGPRRSLSLKLSDASTLNPELRRTVNWGYLEEKSWETASGIFAGLLFFFFIALTPRVE